MKEGGGEVTEALEGGETAGGIAAGVESGEGDADAITFLFSELNFVHLLPRLELHYSRIIYTIKHL